MCPSMGGSLPRIRKLTNVLKYREYVREVFSQPPFVCYICMYMHVAHFTLDLIRLLNDNDLTTLPAGIFLELGSATEVVTL